MCSSYEGPGASQGTAKGGWRASMGLSRRIQDDRTWYRRAAERGSASAQNRLGVMYRDGVGIAQDYEAAVGWFRPAAEQGHAGGQNNLGVMYGTGRGVSRDDAEAVRWYRRAAEQGHALAQNDLGVRYRDGRGVPQDYDTADTAARWFRRAADQGHTGGPHTLRERGCRGTIVQGWRACPISTPYVNVQDLSGFGRERPWMRKGNKMNLNRQNILVTTLFVVLAGSAHAQDSVNETIWNTWTPAPYTPPSSVEAALQANLIQHAEAAADIETVSGTFPLADDFVNGRQFWVAEVVLVANVTSRAIVVYERRSDSWHKVAQHEMDYQLLTVAPVTIEPTQAWIVASGLSGARAIQNWEFLRFDSVSLQSEIYENWFSVMLADVDLDGTTEVLSEQINPVCYPCTETVRSVNLYRWTGTQMVEVSLETLPAGSASNVAIAANNRVVELSGAGRWAEARIVLSNARHLVAESVVFRRNAALIDLNAVAPDGSLSEDQLLHYVRSGLWRDAVDIFRGAPVPSDFFASDVDTQGWTPPHLRAVFNAAVRARTVPPASPEIEFLYALAAYHLDPDTGSGYWMGEYPSYLVDSESTAVLEALDHAIDLAVNKQFFRAVRRVVGELVGP